MRRALAVIAGLALFALPFLQSGLWGEQGGHGSDRDSDKGTAHMDHEAHHGGSLLMLGDHHIEVVNGPEILEVYVSDSARRPVQPKLAFVRFDSGGALAMQWSGYRSVVPRPADYKWADYRIALDDGPPLIIRLPAGGVTMPGAAK